MFAVDLFCYEIRTELGVEEQLRVVQAIGEAAFRSVGARRPVKSFPNSICIGMALALLQKRNGDFAAIADGAGKKAGPSTSHCD